jgi:hypothetical protein
MKTLLLDVDGVIIRDRVLLDHVKNNAIRYVRTKIPDHHNAARLNSLLYKAYGHTAIGIEREYGIDAKDFDSNVYNPILLSHLTDFIENSEDFKNDSKIIQKILSMGFDVELFSNAPLTWTEPIKRSIDERIKNGVYSKPELKTYVKFNPYKEYVFVDDKVCNLMPSLFFKNWTPVHFSEHVEFTSIPTINSLDNILKFL